MDSVKERIEKEAEAVAHKWTTFELRHLYKEGYIAGATSERNKAIQDAIDVMKGNPVGLDAIDEAIIERLEKLKL